MVCTLASGGSNKTEKPFSLQDDEKTDKTDNYEKGTFKTA